VISAGAKHPASTYGGSETVVLSPDQMPSHTHQLKTHAVGYASGWNSKNEAVASSATDRDNGDSSYNTTSTGNSAPLTIMPPFYALAFIMRTQ
jgi:microcystin-dependent protein